MPFDFRLAPRLLEERERPFNAVFTLFKRHVNAVFTLFQRCLNAVFTLFKRCSPRRLLEERDQFFTKMKKIIEQMVDDEFEPLLPHATQGITVIAHSMGNNIFRYFLDWLKATTGE